MLHSLGLLIEADALVTVPTRHVRQNHGVAFLQSFQNLNRIHRRPTHLHSYAGGILPIRTQLKQADSAALLPNGGTADIQDVVEPLQVDGAVPPLIPKRSL